MSSDAIEGEPSHLEVNPIFSPSIPTLDILFEPISQPILDPNDPSYVLSPKSHDDPRNPLRQLFTPKFGRKVTGTQKLPKSYHQGISCGQIRNS